MSTQTPNWLKFDFMTGQVLGTFPCSADEATIDVNNTGGATITAPAYFFTEEERNKWGTQTFTPWKIGIALPINNPTNPQNNLAYVGIITSISYTTSTETYTLTTENPYQYFLKTGPAAAKIWSPETNLDATLNFGYNTTQDLYKAILRYTVTTGDRSKGWNFPQTFQGYKYSDTDLGVTQNPDPNDPNIKKWETRLSDLKTVATLWEEIRDGDESKGEEFLITGTHNPDDTITLKIDFGTETTPHINYNQTTPETLELGTYRNEGGFGFTEYTITDDYTLIFNKLLVAGEQVKQGNTLNNNPENLPTLTEPVLLGEDVLEASINQRLNQLVAGGLMPKKVANLTLTAINAEETINNFHKIVNLLGKCVKIQPTGKSIGQGTILRATNISFTNTDTITTATIELQTPAARYPKLQHKDKQESISNPNITIPELQPHLPNLPDTNWGGNIGGGGGGGTGGTPPVIPPYTPPPVTISGKAFDKNNELFYGVTITAYANAEKTLVLTSAVTNSRGEYKMNINVNTNIWLTASKGDTIIDHPANPIEVKTVNLYDIDFKLPITNPLKLYKIEGQLLNADKTPFTAGANLRSPHNFGDYSYWGNYSITTQTIPPHPEGKYTIYLPEGEYFLINTNSSQTQLLSPIFEVTGKDITGLNHIMQFTRGMFAPMPNITVGGTYIQGVKVEVYSDPQHTKLLGYGYTQPVNISGNIVLTKKWEDTRYYKATYAGNEGTTIHSFSSYETPPQNIEITTANLQEVNIKLWDPLKEEPLINGQENMIFNVTFIEATLPERYDGYSGSALTNTSSTYTQYFDSNYINPLIKTWLPKGDYKAMVYTPHTQYESFNTSEVFTITDEKYVNPNLPITMSPSARVGFTVSYEGLPVSGAKIEIFSNPERTNLITTLYSSPSSNNTIGWQPGKTFSYFNVSKATINRFLYIKASYNGIETLDTISTHHHNIDYPRNLLNVVHINITAIKKYKVSGYIYDCRGDNSVADKPIGLGRHQIDIAPKIVGAADLSLPPKFFDTNAQGYFEIYLPKGAYIASIKQSAYEPPNNWYYPPKTDTIFVENKDIHIPKVKTVSELSILPKLVASGGMDIFNTKVEVYQEDYSLSEGWLYRTIASTITNGLPLQIPKNLKFYTYNEDGSIYAEYEAEEVFVRFYGEDGTQFGSPSRVSLKDIQINHPLTVAYENNARTEGLWGYVFPEDFDDSDNQYPPTETGNGFYVVAKKSYNPNFFRKNWQPEPNSNLYVQTVVETDSQGNWSMDLTAGEWWLDIYDPSGKFMSTKSHKIVVENSSIGNIRLRFKPIKGVDYYEQADHIVNVYNNSLPAQKWTLKLYETCDYVNPYVITTPTSPTFSFAGHQEDTQFTYIELISEEGYIVKLQIENKFNASYYNNYAPTYYNIELGDHKTFSGKLINSETNQPEVNTKILAEHETSHTTLTPANYNATYWKVAQDVTKTDSEGKFCFSLPKTRWMLSGEWCNIISDKQYDITQNTENIMLKTNVLGGTSPWVENQKQIKGMPIGLNVITGSVCAGNGTIKVFTNPQYTELLTEIVYNNNIGTPPNTRSGTKQATTLLQLDATQTPKIWVEATTNNGVGNTQITLPITQYGYRDPKMYNIYIYNNTKISGTVLNSDNTPAVNEQLWLYNTQLVGSPAVGTITDSEGNFVFHTPTGKWVITNEINTIIAHNQIDTTNGDVDNVVLTKNVSTGGQTAIQVFVGGTASREGTIKVFSDSNYTTLLNELTYDKNVSDPTTTSTYGYVHMLTYNKNVNPTVWVEAEQNGAIGRTSVQITEHAGSEPQAVKINIADVFLVSGKVNTVAPIQNQQRTITVSSTGHSQQIVARVTTDNNGNWSTTLPQGTYTITPSGDQTDNIEHKLVKVIDSDITNIQTTIKPEGRRISGNITINSIQPSNEDTTLNLYSDANFTNLISSKRIYGRYTTSVNYDMHNIPVNTTEVWARLTTGGLNYPSPQNPHNPQTNDISFNVDLTTYTLTGKVTNVANEPITYSSVEIYNLPYYANYPQYYAVTDGEGKYEVELPKGTYYIWTPNPHNLQSNDRITLTGNTTKDIQQKTSLGTLQLVITKGGVMYENVKVETLNQNLNHTTTTYSHNIVSPNATIEIPQGTTAIRTTTPQGAERITPIPDPIYNGLQLELPE